MYNSTRNFRRGVGGSAKILFMGSKIRSGAPVDETWVNRNTYAEKCWTNKEGTAGLHMKHGKNGRFLIAQGFFPGALLLLKSVWKQR